MKKIVPAFLVQSAKEFEGKLRLVENDCTLIQVDVLDGSLFENTSWFDAETVGAMKTNVEFVKVIDRTNLRMRVWERGCGITMACGTGSAAALVAAVLTDNSEKKATIILDGGQLELEWTSAGHILKTGPAVEVFRGELI